MSLLRLQTRVNYKRSLSFSYHYLQLLFPRALLPVLDLVCRFPQSRHYVKEQLVTKGAWHMWYYHVHAAQVTFAARATWERTALMLKMEAILQADLSSLRSPLGGDKVYKDECIYSFHTPVRPYDVISNDPLS